VLVWGAALAPIVFWVGGWLFHLRVRWSGDKRAPLERTRRVYLYASLIWTAPVIVMALLDTVAHATYREAWSSDQPLELVVLVFIAWSLWLAYAAVTRLFEVRPWPARLWFLILPGAVYAAVLVGTALLPVLLDGPSTMVLFGDEVPGSDVRILIEEGYLEPQEELLLFYSAGLVSIREDGNFFTDRRVVSYGTFGDEVYHAAAAYDEIVALDVDYSDSLFADSRIFVETADQVFILLASPEGGRDRVFYERLVQEWERRRGARRRGV
jgi:hypothetical protein